MRSVNGVMEPFVEARQLEVAQNAELSKRQTNTQPEQNAMQSLNGVIEPFGSKKRDQGAVLNKRQVPTVQSPAQSLDGTIQPFDPTTQQKRKREINKRQAPTVQSPAQSLDGTIQPFDPTTQQKRDWSQ
jgi:hypothetical protein